MEWTTMHKLIETLGLPVAMLLFFIWLEIKRRGQDERREKTSEITREQLAQRLAAVEDYQRKELQQLVIENTTALQNHAEASNQMTTTAREQTQIHRQLITALRTRPCLEQAVDHIEREGA